MRFRAKKIFLGLFIFLTTIILGLFVTYQIIRFRSDFKPKPGKVEKIEFVIVKNYFGFNQTNIIKPNAALVITDIEEINKDQQLFLAKKEIQHYCGYDYEIQFWYNCDSLSTTSSINQSCESFSYRPLRTWSQFLKYKYKLATKPTHYLYSLKLPVNVEPEKIKSILRKDGYLIIVLDNLSGRFPNICFSFNNNFGMKNNPSESDWIEAEKRNEIYIKNRLKKIIDRIEDLFIIKEKSDVLYESLGKDNKEVANSGVTTLTFEVGTDLNKIKSIIKDEGALIKKIHIPEKYYIQLLDPSDNLENVKNRLKKYKLITEVSEYDDSAKNLPDIEI